MFDTFNKQQQELYAQEVSEKYDPTIVAQSKEKIAKFTKQDWAAIKNESEIICRELTERLDLRPENQEIQVLAKRYHTLMNRFYDCSLTILFGLGNIYVEDPGFRANYDAYDKRLA